MFVWFFFLFSHSGRKYTYNKHTHTSLTRSTRRIWKLHIFAFVYFKHFIQFAIHVIVLLFTWNTVFCIYVVEFFAFVHSFAFFLFLFCSDTDRHSMDVTSVRIMHPNYDNLLLDVSTRISYFLHISQNHRKYD